MKIIVNFCYSLCFLGMHQIGFIPSKNLVESNIGLEDPFIEFYDSTNFTKESTKDTIFVDSFVTITTTFLNSKTSSKNFNSDDNPVEKNGYLIFNPEWYPFRGWKYDYDPIKYSTNELDLMTDIITRESNSVGTLGKKIDQYFVLICFVRQFYRKGYKSITEHLKKTSQFTYPVPKHRHKECWRINRDVVKNVLNREIPEYVPYLPEGTVSYWNDMIDNNEAQRRSLMKYYVRVATTVKGTHYFARWEFMSKKEKEFLKEFVNMFGDTKMFIKHKKTLKDIPLIGFGAFDRL